MSEMLYRRMAAPIGMTYFVDVRGLKGAINAISDLAAARLRADWRSGRSLGHSASNKYAGISAGHVVSGEEELGRGQYLPTPGPP